MKRGLIVVAIIIVIILILVIIFYPKGEEIPPNASCKIDSDCVRTENPCCSCNNGGAAYPVNKDYVEYVRSLIYEGCKNISNFCPMPEGYNRFCNSSVKCWDGMCGFNDYNPRQGIVISGNWSNSQ